MFAKCRIEPSSILTIKSLPSTVRTSPRSTRTTSLLWPSRILVFVCTCAPALKAKTVQTVPIAKTKPLLVQLLPRFMFCSPSLNSKMTDCRISSRAKDMKWQPHTKSTGRSAACRNHKIPVWSNGQRESQNCEPSAFLPVDLCVTVRASPVSVSRKCKGQSGKGISSAWDESPCDYSERQSEVDANVDWTSTQLGKYLMVPSKFECKCIGRGRSIAGLLFLVPRARRNIGSLSHPAGYRPFQRRVAR